MDKFTEIPISQAIYTSNRGKENQEKQDMFENVVTYYHDYKSNGNMFAFL